MNNKTEQKMEVQADLSTYKGTPQSLNQSISAQSSYKNIPNKQTGSLPKIKNTRQLLATQLFKISQYGQPNVISSEHHTKKYVEIYQWTNQKVQYQTLSFRQIAQEHKNIVKALTSINVDLENYMSKNVYKLEKKIQVTAKRFKTEESRTPHHNKSINNETLNFSPTDKRKNVQEKQISNNKTVIQMCKKQYHSLAKREKHFKTLQKQSTILSSYAAKESVEGSIDKTKNSIEETRKFNTKLKIKNKMIGDTINTNEEFLSSMLRLEQDVQSLIKRKQKLSQHLSQTVKANQQTILKIKTKQPQFQNACEYFRKVDRKQTEDKQWSENKNSYDSKSKMKNLIEKKKDYFIHELQKIYHQHLKQLEGYKSNLSDIEEKDIFVSSQNDRMKVEIRILEGKLKKVRNNRKTSRMVNNLFDSQKKEAQLGKNDQQGSTLPMRGVKNIEENKESSHTKRNNQKQNSVIETDRQKQFPFDIDQISQIRKTKNKQSNSENQQNFQMNNIYEKIQE